MGQRRRQVGWRGEGRLEGRRRSGKGVEEPDPELSSSCKVAPEAAKDRGERTLDYNLEQRFSHLSGRYTVEICSEYCIAYYRVQQLLSERTLIRSPFEYFRRGYKGRTGVYSSSSSALRCK